ncbi:hypothetical protein BKA64DRAFT_717168 [Cadophora sp. MPI-SDFR-AT-0126]|nr:hypothetical protein BKA64DRAFT_717168 [Leotiomycetes sp. MPI-SDFR-AT-0126]
MAEPAVAIRQTAISLEFRDMDEFVAEQEAIDNQLGNINPPARANNNILQDPQVIVVENAAIGEIGHGNWIGKLIEYRQANPVEADNDGIKYTETTLPGRVSPRFSCTVQISESDEIFGCSGNYGFTQIVASFSVKKVAKQFAAKRAIDFLIANKHMPNDGTVRFPRPPPPPSPTNPLAVPDGQLPYTTQVPLLCRRLGFNTPTYKITPVIPNTPACDGYADFGDDPRVDGKVGKVENVYGKKNAKEAVARLVILFLKDIERQRMGE